MFQLPTQPREEHILRLQKDSVPESPLLDYKSEMYASNDEGKREMLRDIVAFANAGGGHIVLGIEEQDLVPSGIVGVANAHDEREKIIASARSGIDPRVIGFDVQVVDIAGKNPVLVIFVPRSSHGPHMVTFRELFQFWKRVGTSKHRMSSLEIREHCMRSELLRTRMEEFLEKHWQQALGHVAGKPGQYFSITPLSLEEESVNVFDPEIQGALYRVLLPETLGTNSPGNARPSLYGVECQEESGTGLLRLFRNGHLDYMDTLDQEFDFQTLKVDVNGKPESRVLLLANRWFAFPWRLLKLVQSIYQRSNLSTPVVIQCGVISALNLTMTVASEAHVNFRIAKPYRGPEQHIRFQLQYEQDWEPAKVAKQMADRLWNAFGSRECPFMK